MATAFCFLAKKSLPVWFIKIFFYILFRFFIDLFFSDERWSILNEFLCIMWGKCWVLFSPHIFIPFVLYHLLKILSFSFKLQFNHCQKSIDSLYESLFLHSLSCPWFYFLTWTNLARLYFSFVFNSGRIHVCSPTLFFQWLSYF